MPGIGWISLPPEAAIESYADISLRPATPEDAERLFAWRNLPEIVALGTTQRPVTWEEHAAWFAQTLRSESRLLRFILHGGQPIGQVRFDREDSASCRVSIYLLPAFTGLGLGVTALQQACAEVFREWDVAEIHAWIRADNRRSLSAFARAGFVPKPEPCAEIPADHCVLCLKCPS